MNNQAEESNNQRGTLYLKKGLVEHLLALLAVLSEHQLAEVWKVDQAVDRHLVGHVYHLLLARIQTQSLHPTQDILVGDGELRTVETF